jgi:hypothetical protein
MEISLGFHYLLLIEGGGMWRDAGTRVHTPNGLFYFYVIGLSFAVMKIVAVRNHIRNFTLCCSRTISFLLEQLCMYFKELETAEPVVCNMST